MQDQLIDAVSELNEDLVIDIVNKKLSEGANPISIVKQVQEGVNKVGIYYDQGKYFIADLIMSGLIFKEVMKLIDFPSDTPPQSHQMKTIFATVEKDIHDIGKNIAITYFNSKGIKPIDLGVNVSPNIILDQIEENEPVVLFLSGLITSSYYSMKKTISLLKEKGLKDHVIVIICGLVDEGVKNYVEADYFIKDVVESYELYLEITKSINRREDNSNE